MFLLVNFVTSVRGLNKLYRQTMWKKGRGSSERKKERKKELNQINIEIKITELRKRTAKKETYI